MGKWFVIVNPNAGKRRGQHDWKQISRMISSAGIDYLSYFTEHRGHAMELTRKYIHNGFRNIIVVGGDGTLNEVVNGIFTQKHVDPLEVTLAMIPVGTGNDWCRMFGIPSEYDKAIDVIVKRNRFLQDVGILEYSGLDGRRIKRYFVNIAGMGFDAMVAEKTNRQKDLGKSNPLSYFVNIFSSLFGFQTVKTTIKLRDKTIHSDVFSMTAAIGRFNGGGMKQAPDAVPDDGLFDITIIRPIGKFKVIRNILKLLDGSYIRLPEVSTWQSDSIRIESLKEIYVETDGESLGHTPFDFSILPKSLHIVTGNGYEPVQEPAEVTS
jgi:YegS/Rv2252/BmrU family lipid kinase